MVEWCLFWIGLILAVVNIFLMISVSRLVLGIWNLVTPTSSSTLILVIVN